MQIAVIMMNLNSFSILGIFIILHRNKNYIVMKKIITTLLVISAIVMSCEKIDLPDPKINTFSADPTTLPKRDPVTFTIDAEGDFISFYDGKTIIDLSEEDMPYTHNVERIRFRVTAPADTVWAKISVTNVYDTDNIKTVSDSIELILLD